MNRNSAWDDAQIHAHIDGELDAVTAARLEADSRDDAELAARITRQFKLRRQLQAAFDPVLDEPVPQRLRDIGSAPQAQIITLDAARRSREPPRWPAWARREWGAIAATLVLGALLGALVIRTPGALPMQTIKGQLVARGDLDTALSIQLAGTAGSGAAVNIGLSFRAANGDWCRTFSLRSGSAGLACRRQGHWAVQMLEGEGTSAAGVPGGFRQADSALSPAMLGAIDALDAGEALTREQEQQQLRTGWETATP